MLTIKPVCKDCTKRCTGCHDTCQEYQVAKAEYLKEVAECRETREKNYMFSSKWKKIKRNKTL